MIALNARIGHPDEDGHRTGYATVELADYEIMGMRKDAVARIEKGVSLYLAKCLLEDIAVLDKALSLIRFRREQEKEK